MKAIERAFELSEHAGDGSHAPKGGPEPKPAKMDRETIDCVTSNIL